jgi:hypothetical protein
MMRPLAARTLGFAMLCVAAPVEAADFYVDPENGDMSGDGSADAPWRTIQEVLDQGLVESQEWAELPYAEGAELVPKNEGAPVRAGDTLWLRSGYHGELDISSYYNPDFITIAAEDGHTPEVSLVHVWASSFWILRGLLVSAELAPTYEPHTLVALESHSWRGPVHDIAVEGCAVQSVADASTWSAADWDSLSCNGFEVDGTNMTLRNNTLRNVNFGISVSATHSLVEGNTVDGFAGDGMRGLGDYTTFQYNTVKNCYDVNDNHDDGFQSWSVGADGAVGTGEVKGIVLRGNLILNYEDPNQPYRGTLQGIGCFDGMFVDWVVENNVVITDHWHGITLSGARNARIVNNTVVDLNDVEPGPPWIRIGDHKDGTPSSDCLIANNLTFDISTDEASDVTVEDNLIIEDPYAVFVDFDGHDLHLSQDSPAVDAANDAHAPELDRDRIPRPQGEHSDLGAYEWHEPEVSSAPGGAGGYASGGIPGLGGRGDADGATAEAGSGDASGCGCRLAQRDPGRGGLAGLALAALMMRWRRPRRDREVRREARPG